MLAVIYGGSGSGKSEFAENMAVSLEASSLYYIATMQPYDEESYKKIDRHRQMRSEKNFRTIECYTDISKVQVEKNSTVLLECMSNLAANEIFSPEGAGDETFDSIKRGVQSLMGQAENLIIVTNNIFEDGLSYDAQMLYYLETLGRVNTAIGGLADCVVEVIHGVALYIKNK